jgi:hypothetical protein
VDEQRIPGVRDAKRSPITEKAYAIWTAGAVAIGAVGMVAVTQLPGSDTVNTVNFELAGPASTSCTYDAGAQKAIIRTHLDSTTRNGSEVVLTAGVRDTSTEAVAAKTDKTVHVRGHHQADYTFVVDVPTTVHVDGAIACFVESAAMF